MHNKILIKNEDFQPFGREFRFALDRKSLIVLLCFLSFTGISLPLSPFYTIIGILFISLIALALLHEKLLLIFLILAFGTSLRIGEGFMPVSFSATELMIYFLILLYLKEIMQIDLRRLVKEPVAFVFFIFLFSRIISAALHLPDDPSHMLSIIRDSIVPMLSFMVSIVMVRKFGVRKVLLSWVVVGIFFAILGIIQSNTGKFLFLSEEGESTRDYLKLLLSGTIGTGQVAVGLFAHHNTYALYLQQILMLSLALYLFGKEKPYRLVMLLISGLLLIAIFYTFSRGGYVAVFLSMIILLLLYSNKTRIIGAGLILLMIIFVIQIILPYFFKYYEQFETLIGRFHYWKSGLNVLKNDPISIIYGVGSGNFKERAGTSFTAHNVYLLYLVENGLFVLLALVCFIFTWLKHLFVKYWKNKDSLGKILYFGLFTGSFGYFVHEIIEHSFNSATFLSICAFWIGLVSQYEKEEYDGD